MRFGFFPIEGGRFWPEALDETLLGEELGFDSVWLAEHHGVRDHYWPAPLLALAGLASRTRRLTLGTNVAVFPFYHPVRLAEETALLDVMSGGRVVLGLAIGYKPDEFALYGASLARRGARFEDGLALMKALWTGERVTHRGAFFDVEEGTIEPRSVQRPHPPVWIGGWGEVTLRRAALLSEAWVPGPTADIGRLVESRRAIEGHRAAAGLPPFQEWPVCRELALGATEREARAFAERYLLAAYRSEYAAAWNHPLIRPPVVRDLDTLARDRFLVGSPDQVIRQIEGLRDRFGATHLIFRLFLPGIGHAAIRQTLTLFAREVMPAFR